MLRQLARTIAAEAGRSAREAFIANAPISWLERVVLLDASVILPAGRRGAPQAPLWKRLAHGLVPPTVFNIALLEVTRRQGYKLDVGGRRPAYAMAGSGKAAGVVCIDDKLGKESKEVFLPRMVRMRDGREVLQQTLIQKPKPRRKKRARSSTA